MLMITFGHYVKFKIAAARGFFIAEFVLNRLELLSTLVAGKRRVMGRRGLGRSNFLRRRRREKRQTWMRRATGPLTSGTS